MCLFGDGTICVCKEVLTTAGIYINDDFNLLVEASTFMRPLFFPFILSFFVLGFFLLHLVPFFLVNGQRVLIF